MRYVKILCVCVACFVMTGCSSVYMGGAWPKMIRQRANELRTAAEIPGDEACDPLFRKHADFLDTVLTAAGQKTSLEVEAELKAELGGEL